MRKLAILTLAGAFLAANSTHAASLLDFDIWMRKIDKRIVDVQRKLEAQDDAAATAQAQEIEDLYARMENYFIAAGNAENAAKLSRESKELAQLIGKAVAAKDYEAGGNAAASIAKACTTCHDLYRPFP